MTDLLTIGATATQLYRQALSTVSNNIANINSEGYSRQEVTSAENAPSQQGVSYVGTGARLIGIQRAYDEFAEGSIRTAQSSLSAQEPMVQYTDRIINLIGSETGGLSSAIDKFFSSATQLSTNPSEETYRQEFLSSSNFFTSRVRSIATDLSAIETEMKSEITGQVDELNKLGTSLALVNRQLGKNSTQAKQPAALLDQRDHLMHEMSKLAKLDFTFDTAGRVDVKLSGSSSNTTFVKTNESKNLSVAFPNRAGSPIAVTFDPYGDNINVGALKGGSIGGLLSFRDDVFEPLRDDIDDLVFNLASSVNTVHAGGMNQKDETGVDLFNLDIGYQALNVDGTVNDTVSIATSVGSATAVPSFSAQWVAADSSWLITDLATSVSSAVKPSSMDGRSLEVAGLSISLNKAPVSGQQFTVSPTLRVSENISVAISETSQIASAGRMQVNQSVNNSRLVDVTLEYGVASPAAVDAKTLNSGLKPDFLTSATIATNSTEPAVYLPKGSQGFEISINPGVSGDQALQLFTAQRNQVAGTALSAEFRAGFDKATSLEPDASYISDYANKSGASGYLDQEFSLGAHAEGLLLSGLIPKQSNVSGSSETLIAAGALTLNGQALGALSLADSATLDAAAVASWVNGASGTGVTATASNVILVDPLDFDNTSRLSINGTAIIGDTYPATAQELVGLINAASATTKVSADVTADGLVEIRNSTGNEGANITLGSDGSDTSNFLGRSNGLVTGRVLYEGDAVGVGFADYFNGQGSASDLSRLGLQTTLSSTQELKEDLYFYASGTASTVDIIYRTGSVAEKTAAELEPALEFKFISATSVEIRDTDSDTLLATRSYDSAKDINFGDLRVRFSEAPATGDIYTVKPNLGGLGDNATIAALANIQNVRLENGEIPVQSYISMVNNVGNVNSLSKMSAEALEVVYNDAVAVGDAASGVSLDDEAANLIRFQQSYQAAAQIIKISGDLFDSILSASR